MGMRLQAMRELVSRYRAVLSFAWAQRKEMDPPVRLSHEAQFLPAALALQDTPVHPAPRITMWLLISFALIAFVWAMIGKIDIVATATGKIIPNDRTKVIQPLESAVIKSIYVRDGQAVKQGDLLIELDATSAQADTDRLTNDWLAARYEALRAQAFLRALDGEEVGLIVLEASSQERQSAEKRLFTGQWDEYQSKLNALDAEITRRAAEMRATQEIVKKLTQTAPLARQRADDVKGLLDKKYVSKHMYLEQEQIAIEQARELAAQKAKQAEFKAALEEARLQRESVSAEARRVQLDLLHQSEQKGQALQQELIKAEQRSKFMQLTAPVDGTVQQLAVHTVGGVVTPAQPLMVIVPRDNVLEVEAFVANKDIGFIYPDQTARVKIETFNFTKYGTIDGQVVHVSTDAIQDENLGLIYSARVLLSHHTMQIENKSVNLTPGMAVTVEISTGKRRLIEYFLSPLLRYKDESLNER